MLFRFLVLGFVCGFLNSCSLFQREKDLPAYMAWLNDEENGLIKKRYINDLVLTAKYLPPEFLAYQELRNEKPTQEKKDSLINAYKKTLTFVLTVGPDERDSTAVSSDVMYKNLNSMQGYKQRAVAMNFEMAEYVELTTSDSTRYVPVLTNMENTYSLGKDRNIVVVFSPGTTVENFTNSKEFDLVWDDVIFESGRNHFVFTRDNMLSAPRLKF